MGNKLAVRTFAAVLMLGISCFAQVLPLGKVSDPAARVLQQQYISQLQQLSADASTLHFAYSFYFSQTLDIDEVQQKQLSRGSIRFEKFDGQMALAITGNYYASYSSEVMTANQRARHTYQDVIQPLLKLAVARIDRNVPIDGYAFEIAHHVRRKVLNVNTEGPENLMVFIPRSVAERLVRRTDTESQQAALLESQVALNGEPLTLWLTGDDAPADVQDHYLARHEKHAEKKNAVPEETAEIAAPGTLVSSKLIPQSDLLNKIREIESSPRQVSPEALQKLQTTYADTVQRLTSEMSSQAHFVDYAPPAFIAFHNGAYLQLNMNTELTEPAGPSQYRATALAFDGHIAHVLRAASKYFDHPEFDGIDFSTTVHQPGQSGSISLEFVVPFATLLSYARYDCTGQELINHSIVLVNGERITLDLQRAEEERASR